MSQRREVEVDPFSRAPHPDGRRSPWNKGKLIGQKAPLKPKEVWAIGARLQMEDRTRELVLFDLGIDSKLRACNLVKLRVRDVCHGDRVASWATVLQQKTHRPVQFEISPATRDAVEAWIRKAGLKSDDYLFPSRVRRSPHVGTRQYARIVDRWVLSVGLDPAGYGTHSMRRLSIQCLGPPLIGFAASLMTGRIGKSKRHETRSRIDACRATFTHRLDRADPTRASSYRLAPIEFR